MSVLAFSRNLSDTRGGNPLSEATTEDPIPDSLLLSETIRSRTDVKIVSLQLVYNCQKRQAQRQEGERHISQCQHNRSR